MTRADGHNRRITDFLTIQEIRRIRELIKRAPSVVSGTTLVTMIQEEVMTPNIERINRMLGQEMDPKYLAYMALYLLGGEDQ